MRFITAQIRRLPEGFNSSLWIGPDIKTSARAIKTTTPPQLSEEFNAERWRRQISSIYHQHEEQFQQYSERS